MNIGDWNFDPHDEEVLRRGHVVLVTKQLPNREMDTWVELVANRSEQRVSWEKMNGCCIIVKGIN